MNKEEIIKQAIKKAKENGCKKYHGYFAKDWDNAEIRAMVFDIEFAKALFGEEKVVYMQIIGGDPKHRWKAYEYHLMRMVLEKDPLDYIKQLLE